MALRSQHPRVFLALTEPAPMATLTPEKRLFEANNVQVEVAGDRLVCRWGDRFAQELNFADQDLLLRVFRGEDLRQSHTVNHLSQKELTLEPGEYRVELARAHRAEVQVRSSLEPSPSVGWIQDSPGSQVLLWSQINWDQVQGEVQQIHHLDWEEEMSVALRVWWEGGETQWLPVPERDHVTLMGRSSKVELCVLAEDEESRVLKSLFLAQRLAPEVEKVLANVPISVGESGAYLTLRREIVETDTLQVRADWVTRDLGNKLRLHLEKDGERVGPTDLEVGPEGNYYFHGLKPGNYRAFFTKPRGKKEVLSSQVTRLPQEESRVVLMPVTEEKAFAYWHLDDSAWQGLAEKHGDLSGRVRCFLKILIEYQGDWFPRNDLSREVHGEMARDYYLDLPADRLYRAQMVAVVDDRAEEPLTEMSGVCQLGRMVAGTNVLAHKRLGQPTTHPTIRPLRSPTGINKYSIGYLLLHLHAHLPFVPDPVNFGDGDTWRPVGYPQEWYAEAVRETYLPLLYMFERLVREGVDFKLSMDISPPLAAMMKSQRHSADVLAYLERLISLARLEVERTAREEPHYHTVAKMHLRHLRRNRDLFLGYDGDLVGAFRKFQESGHLELCTCIGTHAMLPLWTTVPNSIRGQAMAAAQYHESIFGRPSRGVWLPECAYTPGIEPFLEEAGFHYFFSEEHTVSRGDSRAEFGVNAPVYIKGTQMAVFPRDPETGKQVWSGDEGYPGDPDYLEFHIRGGPFKYNRITDRRGGHKEPYVPDWAENKSAGHAGHFMDCRNARFEFLRRMMWKKPVVIAPYDAELFGHHWYEGPSFLYYLFKKLHFDQNQTELLTPSAYLAANPTSQEMYCNVSTWGHQGTFEKWMYGDTSWMYRHGHEAARALGRAVKPGWDTELKRRVLAQAARQLMLAMSSDLPFVISNGHFIDRMKGLFFDALRDFWRLLDEYQRLCEGADIDVGYLRSLELENCIFPDLDPGWFAQLS